MSDTAEKMLQRTLGGSSVGKNVYSRYLTLTEEQEERVAELLEADDPDPVAIEAAINEQYHADHERMAAIDQQLAKLQRRNVSVEELESTDTNVTESVSTSPSNSIRASSGMSRHTRGEVGAQVDADLPPASGGGAASSGPDEGTETSPNQGSRALICVRLI